MQTYIIHNKYYIVKLAATSSMHSTSQTKAIKKSTVIKILYIIMASQQARHTRINISAAGMADRAVLSHNTTPIQFHHSIHVLCMLWFHSRLKTYLFNKCFPP